MIDPETPVARAAAARAVLRLLARLSRRAAARQPHAASKEDTGALKVAQRRGWVEPDTGHGGWRLSAKGKEFLRRAMSGQDLSIASAAVDDRRRKGASGEAGADNRSAAVATSASITAASIDPDESPLGWLRHRRGRDGQPLISDDEFQAGERLRADFWFAGMTPRVTSRWGEGPTGGCRRSAPGAGAEMRDNVIAAEVRVRRALAAVGPELCGVLIDVCCHLKGIEDAERQAGWPQRAGKIVLRIALAQLARHYGLGVTAAGGAGPERMRHWGTPDFRPRLDDGGT